MTRASLANFAPKKVAPDGGKVVAAEPQAISQKPTRAPSVTVYLTAEEIRTLKLLGIDNGQKITDICATAVREWMERNGHARGKLFKA